MGIEMKTKSLRPVSVTGCLKDWTIYSGLLRYVTLLFTQIA